MGGLIAYGEQCRIPDLQIFGQAMVFPVIMYGCERLLRKLSAEELMLLNCGVGEDS